MTEAQEHMLDIPPFKGRILSHYDVPEVVDALKDCDTLIDKARILEDSRNRVGVFALPVHQGRAAEYVLKEFRTQGVDKWKSCILPSKAQKAWRGSLALVERGFPTPLPVAYLERRSSLFLEQGYFITEYVQNIQEVRGLFRNLSLKALTPLLQELARHLARLTASGLLHRDLSDGNILVERQENGLFRFFLLDTNRIRCRKRVGPYRGIKSLVRLGVPQDLQRFFLAQYLSRPTVKGVYWLWYRMNKSCFTAYIRLKERLGLKRLARWLKIQ